MVSTINGLGAAWGTQGLGKAKSEMGRRLSSVREEQGESLAQGGARPGPMGRVGSRIRCEAMVSNRWCSFGKLELARALGEWGRHKSTCSLLWEGFGMMLYIIMGGAAQAAAAFGLPLPSRDWGSCVFLMWGPSDEG